MPHTRVANPVRRRLWTALQAHMPTKHPTRLTWHKASHTCCTEADMLVRGSGRSWGITTSLLPPTSTVTLRAGCMRPSTTAA